MIRLLFALGLIFMLASCSKNSSEGKTFNTEKVQLASISLGDHTYKIGDGLMLEDSDFGITATSSSWRYHSIEYYRLVDNLEDYFPVKVTSLSSKEFICDQIISAEGSYGDGQLDDIQVTMYVKNEDERRVVEITLNTDDSHEVMKYTFNLRMKPE